MLFGRRPRFALVLVSTFCPFRTYETPLVSTFWRFRTYENGGRVVFTIRRGEYRNKTAAPAFGRGRGLSTFSISGGRLLLSLYHLRGATKKAKHTRGGLLQTRRRGLPYRAGGAACARAKTAAPAFFLPAFAPLLLFITFAVE